MSKFYVPAPAPRLSSSLKKLTAAGFVLFLVKGLLWLAAGAAVIKLH